MAFIACLSAAALVWIGYRSVVQWEEAAGEVAARRAESAVDLLVAALARDMRGAQQTMLTSADRDGLAVGAGADLLRPIGNALARYPYPEVFFLWRDSPTPESVSFYARPERRPSWLGATDSRKMFPVVAGREPQTAARLIRRAAIDSVARSSLLGVRPRRGRLEVSSRGTRVLRRSGARTVVRRTGFHGQSRLGRASTTSTT